MAKLRLQMSTSLDGYVAGPNQSVDEPLGEGGEQLHEWAFALKAFRDRHGIEGGEVNASNAVAEQMQANVGATIMGRKMFGGGPGPWDADAPWNGWWGNDPPFHHRVFVLTHHPREPLAMAGGTTFHFITDGIEPALERAVAAAGEMDVAIGGGAQTAQQYLAAGLVDELEVHIVPILLGSGERLFDNVGSGLELRLVGNVDGPGVSHLKYEVRAP